MSTEELYKLLRDQEFTIEDVINAIIQLNGIVGVGRISLGDILKDFCYHKADVYLSDGVHNKELKSQVNRTLASGKTVGIDGGGQVWQSNHRNGTTL